MNSSSLENDILAELEKITKLLSLIATKGDNQRQQITLLDSVGFQPKEIAELLGTTPNNVRVTLVSIRKKSKQRKQNNEQ